MSDRPSYREMRVLQALCFGNVEAETYFQPGVGAKTLSEMVRKGWIEPATDETYGTEGYRWTALGEQIWKDADI